MRKGLQQQRSATSLSSTPTGAKNSKFNEKIRVVHTPSPFGAHRMVENVELGQQDDFLVEKSQEIAEENLPKQFSLSFVRENEFANDFETTPIDRSKSAEGRAYDQNSLMERSESTPPRFTTKETRLQPASPLVANTSHNSSNSTLPPSANKNLDFSTPLINVKYAPSQSLLSNPLRNNGQTNSNNNSSSSTSLPSFSAHHQTTSPNIAANHANSPMIIISNNRESDYFGKSDKLPQIFSPNQNSFAYHSGPSSPLNNLYNTNTPHQVPHHSVQHTPTPQETYKPAPVEVKNLLTASIDELRVLQAKEVTRGIVDAQKAMENRVAESTQACEQMTTHFDSIYTSVVEKLQQSVATSVDWLIYNRLPQIYLRFLPRNSSTEGKKKKSSRGDVNQQLRDTIHSLREHAIDYNSSNFIELLLTDEVKAEIEHLITETVSSGLDGFVEQVHGMIADVKCQIINLKHNNVEMDDVVTEMKTQNSILMDRLETLETQNQELKDQNDELRMECKEKELQMDIMKEQLDIRNKQLDEQRISYYRELMTVKSKLFEASQLAHRLDSNDKLTAPVGDFSSKFTQSEFFEEFTKKYEKQYKSQVDTIRQMYLSEKTELLRQNKTEIEKRDLIIMTLERKLKSWEEKWRKNG